MRQSVAGIAKKAMFALEPCIAFDKKAKAKKWFDPLLYDPVYLHTISFSVQTYFDLIGSRQRDRVSEHFIQAVHLLRERLALQDEAIKISDPTVAVVLTFAGHAVVTGDFETAKHHLLGLHQIFNLRGGASSFDHNPKQLIEIYR